MSITIVSSNDFNKYNNIIQTGAGSYNLPREDVDALYGPGWPIAPVTRPTDSALPRVNDYPVGINYTLQPRIGYEGLFPIAALKAAYGTVSEVSQPVNLVIRELSAFTPQLRNPKNKQKLGSDHPYAWMTKYPDGRTPFSVWLTKYKKSAKIYAAPAIFKRKEHGRVTAMEYIDGSTFFLIVNERGELPRPDEVDPELEKWVNQIQKGVGSQNFGIINPGNVQMPDIARDYMRAASKWMKKPENAGQELPTTTPAFTQVIKGVPFSFWDLDQVYFVPEPPSSSVDGPYGESYIERSWPWIQIIAVMTAFELGFYRTGNMPEGFATMPKDWFPSMAKLGIAEREYNARMAEGSQVQHSRIRFGPDGMKWIPTKKPDFPSMLYQQANNNILLSIGVPPSEIGQKPGKGLGGKGYEEGTAHEVTRQILDAERISTQMPFNQIMKDEGVDDAEFYLDYPQEEIDPTKQAESLWANFIHGVYTLNDVLSEQGKDPIGSKSDKDNVANLHVIVAGSNFYIVEKMQTDPQGMVIPSGSPQAPGTSAPDGRSPQSPTNPEDLVTGGQPHTPADAATAQKLAQVIELSGGRLTSTKMISIPAVAKELGTGSGYGGYNLEGGGCPEGVDPGEYAMGLKEEQEHAATVNNDQAVIRAIALDHLKEDPRYYTHLREAGMISKADVAGHDGAMVAIFIPDKVAQQLRKITDGLGLPKDAQLELAESLHVTLAFLPDGGQATKESSRVLGCVQSVALGYSPLEGSIQGYGIFNGKDGIHVLYATLDAPDLPFIRTAICEALDGAGIPYAKDHGFVPHVTLAYFPDDWELPKGFSVPDLDCSIDGITFALGSKLTTITFRMGDTRLGKKNVAKVDWAEYFKHCGVCEGDEAYFNAPVVSGDNIPIHTGIHTNDEKTHVNRVELVMMKPADLAPKPAVWKPAGGENLSINQLLGGPQYKREEAVWLLDQCLGFHLVPLAYVSQLEDTGEEGAVVWYVAGQGTDIQNPDQYSEGWIQRASILDCISGQLDRGNRHNYLTHPDDPKRMILIDNGFSFSDGTTSREQNSVFCDQAAGQPISPEDLGALHMCLGDRSTWGDITELVGQTAAGLAHERAQTLFDKSKVALGA